MVNGNTPELIDDPVVGLPDDDGFIVTDSHDECGESTGGDVDEYHGFSDHGIVNEGRLSSPLPEAPENDGVSCWAPSIDSIFHVRGINYFEDRVKIPSNAAPMTCLGVDFWLIDNPERHMARHPSILGGKLDNQDTFLVNFLLPFGNFVAYFSVPPLHKFLSKLRCVWTKFVKGDRDARLKLLPVVLDGPWIVKTAVGNGKSPALLGKVIPLQYSFKTLRSQNEAYTKWISLLLPLRSPRES